MTKHKTIRPINSLIVIEDAQGGEAPEWADGQLILASPSCIFVGCYPEPDGPTQLILGVRHEVDAAGVPAFDGMLETPSRTVAVTTVDREVLLAEDVPGTTTRIRIWPNHDRWPDRIVVGLN